MKIDQSLQADVIYTELVKRARQYRIVYPMTQEELADKAIVSVGTIRRFEKGEDIGALKLIRVLQALGRAEAINLLLVDPEERPSYHLEGEKLRKRAVRKKTATEKNWKWGDDK